MRLNQLSRKLKTTLKNFNVSAIFAKISVIKLSKTSNLTELNLLSQLKSLVMTKNWTNVVKFQERLKIHVLAASLLRLETHNRVNTVTEAANKRLYNLFSQVLEMRVSRITDGILKTPT